MIVSRIELFDFRRFKSDNGEPGLTVEFHDGLNAIIGENDAGKTAVIDAIKLVLQTQSEFIRIKEDDFYYDGIDFVSTFKIHLILSKLTDQEAKNFIEYVFENSQSEMELRLFFVATRENNRIIPELKVCDEIDGKSFTARERELLKAIYLRPLRDAQHELQSGRSSRFSHILLSHPVFKNNQNSQLVKIIQNANKEIEKFFDQENEGQEILGNIREILNQILSINDKNKVNIHTSNPTLKSILESLSLEFDEMGPGLGKLNLLFIASELLLLKENDLGFLQLALIEEIEAHLHPQAQLRLIHFLQDVACKLNVQIILTTHSPILASAISLDNIILLNQRGSFSLSRNKTKLFSNDYLFLERFLNSTRANLFFAKGVIFVEGDAENLLIPIIAEIIDCPLEKYGVSIVNIGGIAFSRYSRVFLQNDNKSMGIPIAIITDCDVKYEDFPEDTQYEELCKNAIKEKTNKLKEGDVEVFVSPYQTLEFCFALSCLQNYLKKSSYYASKLSNNKNLELDGINKEGLNLVETKIDFKQAIEIYNSVKKNKALVAQILGYLLKYNDKKQLIKNSLLKDQNIGYIINAIKYATGVNSVS